MSWECDSSLIWKHNTSNLKTSTSRCITKSVMWWPTWLGGIFVGCKPWTLSSIVHWDDNSKIQQKPITYATVNYNNVAIWAEQGSDINNTIHYSASGCKQQYIYIIFRFLTIKFRAPEISFIIGHTYATIHKRVKISVTAYMVHMLYAKSPAETRIG